MDLTFQLPTNQPTNQTIEAKRILLTNLHHYCVVKLSIFGERNEISVKTTTGFNWMPVIKRKFSLISNVAQRFILVGFQLTETKTGGGLKWWWHDGTRLVLQHWCFKSINSGFSRPYKHWIETKDWQPKRNAWQPLEFRGHLPLKLQWQVNERNFCRVQLSLAGYSFFITY